ncbi:MAG: SnoaL-like domain-containing protein [Ginsengibacter sp.]
MTIEEIATQLVEHCRKGEFKKAQKELFADNAVSIEPEATPAFEKETKGLSAIMEKADKFDSMVEEMHSMDVSDPLVADNSFACTMTLDVTMKERGHMIMKELCVYEVKDGKILKEEFFM